MSSKPAARVGDKMSCPMPQPIPGNPPHTPPTGLPIMPPGQLNVDIEGMKAARMTDKIMCVTPAPVPNLIAKGAFPVPIGGMPAARSDDMGMHPGSKVMPRPGATVEIGLSGTTGNVLVGTEMCQAAAGGRSSGGTNQSYNNCGIESSRQVINQANGSSVGEDAMMSFAKNNPVINSGPPGVPNPIGAPGTPNVLAQGGTFPANQAALMGANGVPASVGSTAGNGLQMAMAQGRGAVVNLDAGALWPTTHGINQAPGAWHAVTVTGIEYDDDGNIVNYIINDTGPGSGNCGVRVPAAVFENAMSSYHTPGGGLVTTNNAIW